MFVAKCPQIIAHLILVTQHLSYPNEFAGDADLIRALAAFFNKYFHPHIPVEEAHVATAPGAATCLNTFLYNLCEPGEGILVPAPFWSECTLLSA
jgi:aspartate/methionine/tyrosine aminotransferase